MLYMATTGPGMHNKQGDQIQKANTRNRTVTMRDLMYKAK